MSIFGKPQRRTPFNFRSDENGALTVEAVLWLPIFMFFFGMIVDVALVLHGQSKAQRIVQDVNRFASTGFYESEDDIKAGALARLQQFAPNATVATALGSADVRTMATIPATDLAAIGLFTSLLDIDMTVYAVHLLEV